MIKRIVLCNICVLLFLFTQGCSEMIPKNETLSRKLEIKDGAFFINDEKTFINALGYEIGARPGQHPYEDEKKLELSRMRNDLEIIKDAGFNAVRTWSELTEEEVALIQESGLLLVYGIWILPDGDFGDEEFISNAEQQVLDVLSWSKKYDCIITYLIMNEPMPDNIKKAGALNTYELWINLTELIHDGHPGIPVTISNNSAIGEYINENIFDVYGYNCYDYKEGLPGYIHRFSNHFNYLKELNGENKPILVTEFGLSVSPEVLGGLYGGQTRYTQARHIIKNVGELLNSDVAGICPFYYADGWWKAGEPGIHNPWPEEWFGFWGYADELDTIGYPRPIWHEFKEYNQAIVASPRSHKIYNETVPVEFFLNEEVSRAKIIYNDAVVLDKAVSAYHFTDIIEFNETSTTDRELIFEFYNESGILLKWESVVILTTNESLVLPSIDLDIGASDLNNVENVNVTFTISNGSIFKIDSDFSYIFVHHEGWNPGEHRSKKIATDKEEFSFSDSYTPTKNCIVLTVAAGVDIKFGKFVKRIYNQQLLYRGDWADPIRVGNSR